MKKNNRILLKAVAILLCLVLITTCVVSSTLAKFVIEKEVGVPVKFKNFGVTMRVKGGNSSGTTSTEITQLDAKSVTVTYDALEVYPGYDNKNLVLFTFDGTLTVPATLKVTVNVELDDEVFYISKDAFPDVGTDADDYPRANAANMPLNFIVGSVYSKDSNSITNSGVSSSWAQARDVTILANNIEKTICSNLRNSYNIKGSDIKPDANNDYYVTKDFAANYTFKTPDASDISYIPPFGIKYDSDSNYRYGCGFGIGINWPIGISTIPNYQRDPNYDIVETWIADKIAKKQAEAAESGETYTPMRITFTVSLEQTGT